MSVRLPLALAVALLIPACGEDPGPVPAALPFSLSSPTDVALDVPVRPAFSWTASRHASWYRLEVATDAGFLNVALDQAGVTTTNFTPGADLARKTDYWWRVTALNSSGQVVAGNAPRTFRTVPNPPGPFSLTAPSSSALNVALRPTFQWTASTDAASYRLEVATTSGFVNIVLDQAGITALNFAPGVDLSRKTDYWWRVTAVNTSGQLVAGNAPRAFQTIPDPPGSFSLVAPESGQAFVSRTPRFEWTASSAASKYTFQLSLAADFSSFVTNASLSAATLSLTQWTPLLPGTTYYWRVVADSAGGPTTAGPRSFTTEPILGTGYPRTGTLIDLAFDPGRNRVYLSNTTDGTIEIFDVGTSAFLAPVAVGANPRGLDITSDGSRLLVCMAGAANLAVLDLSVTPPVLERTVALPLAYAWETPVPSTVACTANGRAFVGIYNAWSPLREINLATWTGVIRNDCQPVTSVQGSPFGVNSARTRLVTSDIGVSGGSWWQYSTATDVFTKINFDDGTSYSAAVDEGGTRAGFSGRLVDFNGNTEASFSDGYKLLFHPDGARLVRIVKDESFVRISDLQTFGDLDLLTVPSDLKGPAALNGTGTILFALAVDGLLVLPISSNRPPILEPLGRLVVTPGDTASALALARDPEGAPVTLSVGSLPPNATFTPSTGQLQFSPDLSQAGQKFAVWISASDGSLTSMARVDLEARATATPVVTFLPIDGTLGRMSFDALRNRLYVSNSDRSRVEVIDMATSSRMAPILVGSGPVGIDQDLASSRLVVCPYGTQFIEVVDLTSVPPVRVIRTPVPDTLYTTLRRPWEIGVAANGKALFASWYGGSGTTAVWELTVATGVVAERTDVPDVNFHIAEPGSFATSRNRLRVFIGAGSITSGSVHRYESSSDSFLARVDTGRFFVQLSTNLDGSRMGMTSTTGTPSKARLYDGSVVFLGEVTESSGASAFSPDSGRMYWTSRVTSELVATETTGMTELFRVPLPAASPFWESDRVAVNAAGDRVFVVVQGGLAIFKVTP